MSAYLDACAGRETGELSRWLIEGIATETSEDVRQASMRLAAATVLRQGPDRAHVAAALVTPDGAPAGTIACELRSEGEVIRAARIGQVPISRAELHEATQWVLEPEPPAYLTGIIGPIPVSSEARMRWVTAAAIVAEYREQWGIDASSTALGPVPADREQLEEREHAVDSVRQLLEDIRRREPHRVVERGVEQPDLGR
jgi:hypothetical protein